MCKKTWKKLCSTELSFKQCYHGLLYIQNNQGRRRKKWYTDRIMHYGNIGRTLYVSATGIFSHKVYDRDYKRGTDAQKGAFKRYGSGIERKGVTEKLLTRCRCAGRWIPVDISAARPAVQYPARICMYTSRALEDTVILFARSHDPICWTALRCLTLCCTLKQDKTFVFVVRNAENWMAIQ